MFDWIMCVCVKHIYSDITWDTAYFKGFAMSKYYYLLFIFIHTSLWVFALNKCNTSINESAWSLLISSHLSRSLCVLLLLAIIVFQNDLISLCYIFIFYPPHTFTCMKLWFNVQEWVHLNNRHTASHHKYHINACIKQKLLIMISLSWNSLFNLSR